jgi:PTS system galactitol-specific IIB component
MMNRPAVILVMCGSSIATSTLAAVKIENEAQKRGISVTVKKGKVSDADMLISGVPLLTGVGQKELYDQIFEIIANLKD